MLVKVGSNLSVRDIYYLVYLEYSYIGRKRMQVDHPETSVPNIHNLVEADYSYWTLGYMLSLQGAQKLLKADPMSKLLPVDEFLPVMYNKHPVWVQPIRPFILFSAPLICLSHQSNHVPAALSHQFRVHGPLWETGPACIFCRAASGVSNPLHRRPGLHQRHGNLGGVGQRDGQNWLGPCQVKEDSGAGGAELWGPELWRAAVWTGGLEHTGRAVMKRRGGEEERKRDGRELLRTEKSIREIEQSCERGGSR